MGLSENDFHPRYDKGRRQAQHPAATRTPKDVSLPVKPDHPSRSTTEALSQWSVALKQPVLTLGVGYVTISTAWLAHSFLHADLRFSLLTGALVGIATVRYQALVSTVVAVLYGLYGALIMLFGVIYVLIARKNPSDYLIGQLTKITNLAIGFQTQVPISVEEAEVSHSATPEPALSPLPAALGSAGTEDPPLFMDTMRAMGTTPTEIVGVVPLAALRPSIGRHAKSEERIESDLATSQDHAMAA
jgi:hypothetical protein